MSKKETPGFSRRIMRLPPYLFAKIDAQKRSLRKKGMTLIDISVGDPDIPAPSSVVSILSRSAAKKENQKYALDAGKAALRAAIRGWLKERFSVSMNVESEILPLIGSKEGLVHFPLAFVNPGDYMLIPSPGYPGYRSAAVFSGARLHAMPLLAGNDFLPDVTSIPRRIRDKAKLMYLNYPNNPTTALGPRSFLREVVRFCSRYGIILAYDNAYSEIYFDKKPVSIFNIPGAKEVAVEFHSLSKTFCMTGFRAGWAAGRAGLIAGLYKVKTNIDSGVFGAVQDAAIEALTRQGGYVPKLRKCIAQRRAVFTAGLRRQGFTHIHADSTFYVWAGIPHGASSIAYASYLLKKGVVATPGVGFGRHGEGYIRFALTVGIPALKKALSCM